MKPKAVGRSENPGVPVLFSGHNLPPLIEIWLTDLPKSGDAMAIPAPSGTTGLKSDKIKFVAQLSSILKLLYVSFPLFIFYTIKSMSYAVWKLYD